MLFMQVSQAEELTSTSSTNNVSIFIFILLLFIAHLKRESGEGASLTLLRNNIDLVLSQFIIPLS